MSSGLTNRFKKNILEAGFRGNGSGKLVVTSDFKLKLIDAGGTPDPDDNIWSDWTGNSFLEVTGGGYSEKTVADTSVGFDVNNQVDASDYGNVQMADQSWTASGSAIVGIGYALLMDDHGTANSRQVYVWWDLRGGGGVFNVGDGSTLTVQDAEVRIT